MGIEQIYPEDLSRYISEKKETDYLLVDVRERGEYESEHIPGAKLLPLSELEGRLDELPEDRELIFYCRSGHRSNVGAMFARDSGLVNGAIYTLIGGISGWEGKILTGFPRFQTLEGVSDLSQTLERAINMEKGAFLFYETMVTLSSGLAREKTVEKLSRMEVGHAKAIYAFLSKIKQVKPFEELFGELKGDIVEGGWDLEAAVERVRENTENACLFMCELALELEYRAYDLYRNLAEKAPEADYKRAMFFLSEQEKAHVRLLTRRLPDCFN
ncbi:MAG: rhodanese-like domain-containing protein [Syntrophobacteraceae bacterium]|nr:rhodanese-like domain-containing protein [Syntrophobacteraceae bacterium]